MVGALAILTAIAFAVIPHFMSYRPVALAAPWDLVMFFLYCAAFGMMKAIFVDPEYTEFSAPKGSAPVDTEQYKDHFLRMRKILWVNLAGMVIFLISAGMGAALWWIGRRNSRNGGASIV